MDSKDRIIADLKDQVRILQSTIDSMDTIIAMKDVKIRSLEAVLSN